MTFPKLFSAGHCPVCIDTGALICVWSLSERRVILLCPSCGVCWSNQVEYEGVEVWQSIYIAAPGGIRLPTELEAQASGVGPVWEAETEFWWQFIKEHFVDPELP